MAERIPWAEWKKKAEKAYVKNTYTVKDMIRDWGFPSDLDPAEKNLLFANGKLTRKNQDTRKQTRGDMQRRASTNEQSLTREDYLKYAKRNGYSAEQANQLYEINETKLAEYRGQKTVDLHYEHLSPSRSPVKGGVEHYRNIVMMQGDLNIGKSDKLATTSALRKAGVPLTKQGALYADFNNLPLPTDQKQIDIILKDLADQPNPKTSRSVRQALSENPAVEQVGEKFKLVDNLKLTPEESYSLNRASTLEAKDNLLTKIKAARLARNVAPVALSVPAGILASGLSAKAAIQDPSQDNLVNAGFDIGNTLADLVGLIPTPMTVAGSEAAQRALMMGQMGYNATRQLQKQQNK